MTQTGEKKASKGYVLRKVAVPGDIQNVREILISSGFFRKDEIDVAEELVEERLEYGDDSGYHFLFLECEGKTVGYVCWGEIPCTIKNFDLYWIAVHQKVRGKGYGAILLNEAENAARLKKGRGMYIETSQREQYEPTHIFYKKMGYKLVSVLENYYDEGDHKAIYYKKL